MKDIPPPRALLRQLPDQISGNAPVPIYEMGSNASGGLIALAGGSHRVVRDDVNLVGDDVVYDLA